MTAGVLAQDSMSTNGDQHEEVHQPFFLKVTTLSPFGPNLPAEPHAPPPSAQSSFVGATSRKPRPKSTPPHPPSYRDVLLSPHTSFAEAKSYRSRFTVPKSAPAHRRCERLDQVEPEQISADKQPYETESRPSTSTAIRHRTLESHLPVKRSKQPQSREESPIPVVVSPGYVLSRSRSKVAMTIKTDGFFDPPKKEVPTHTLDQATQDLISDLRQQISDLTLYLEEEKLNHRDTKKQAAEELKKREEKLNTRHEEEMNKLEDEYEKEIADMKAAQQKLMAQEKAASEAIHNRLTSDLNFMKSSFDTYKTQIVEEMDEKWADKEAELHFKFEERIESAIYDQKKQLINEHQDEKASMNQEFKRQIQTIAREHKRDIDAINKRYANAAQDLERLKRTTEELNISRVELEDKKKQLKETTESFKRTLRELQDANVRLIDFEERFHEKVSEVDDKYRQRMHNLMQENADLRKRYMSKCEELYDVKSQNDIQVQERVQTAKDTLQHVIKTRHRANISIAASDPALDEKKKIQHSRPLSAPTTRKETVDAKLGELQVKDDEQSVKTAPNVGRQKLLPSRPQTCVGRRA
ncbi:flagellum-associated coiled-coil domain-containing protein 1-like isoform X1 [Branchiostoma lanceolatum]|uniref:flagellum-associated coiled-coil domain-containing protein 1-like isoform X1 n=1 Tax=Branchiostoma lanceolatum TaxID=7740 RepID=UPI00345236A4